jgi:putative flavoprotein involved in K+ transport
VVEKQPGLYFVGLTFLYAMSSSMIHGVGRDAARIVRAIKARPGTARLESVPSRAVIQPGEGSSLV